MKRIRTAAVVVFATMSATAARCTYDPPHVLDGTWGGEHMGMVVSDSGARIEYDCAAGAITEPLLVSSDGNFSWRGVFYPGHGGPAMIGEVPEPHAAQYSGRVTGNTMLIVLRVTDSLNITQSYTLTRGGNPSIVRCL
jgi:hypothetical protein